MNLRRLEGLWSAELRTGDSGDNIGVLVFRPSRVFGDFYEEGRIRGGDQFCVYDGRYVIENRGFRGSLTVIRYREGEPLPVFPRDGVFTFTGTIESGVTRQVIEFAVGHARSLRLIRRDAE